ncbi:hypothetical protein T492DRAFT_896332 [Pavlovales sp. CCMP2436]|nr:hypothetical protein T492DRAFT_896332 [Pavlovales sp. CCMP2436]
MSPPAPASGAREASVWLLSASAAVVVLALALAASRSSITSPPISPPPRHPTDTTSCATGLPDATSNDTDNTDMVSSKRYNTPCTDHSDNCTTWKQQGECSANSRFMMITSPFSCELCASTARTPPLPPHAKAADDANLLEEEDACKDESADYPAWAAAGECTKNQA